MKRFLCLLMVLALVLPAIAPLQAAKAEDNPKSVRVELKSSAFKSGSYVTLNTDKVTLLEEKESGTRIECMSISGEEYIFRLTPNANTTPPVINNDDVLFLVDQIDDGNGNVDYDYYLLKVTDFTQDGLLKGVSEKPYDTQVETVEGNGTETYKEDRGYYLDGRIDVDFKGATFTPDAKTENYVKINQGSVSNAEKDFSFSIEKLPLDNTGTVTLSAEVEGVGVATLDYSIRSQWVSTECYIDWKMLDTKISYGANVSFTAIDVPLGKFEVAEAIIFDIAFELSLKVSLSGSPSIMFDVDGKNGFSLDSREGWEPKSLNETPTITYRGIEVDGSVFIGLGFGPEIEVFHGIFKLGGDIKFGYQFTGSLSNVEFYDEFKRWHSCRSTECFSGDCNYIVAWGFGISFLRHSKNIYEVEILHEKIADWYFSGTYADGGFALGEVCPHSGYKLIVHVEDNYGNKLKDVTVSFEPGDSVDRERYETEKKSSAITTKTVDGSEVYDDAVLYIPKGSTSIMASGEVDGQQFSRSVDFEEKGYEESEAVDGEEKKLVQPELTIIIDKRSVTFKDGDPAEPAAARMPTDVTTYSTSVLIPNETPTKEDYLFEGWSDGSSTELIQPGDFYTFDDNKTKVELTAVWKKEWVNVTFDANNGSFADGTAKKAVKLPYEGTLKEADLPDAPVRTDDMDFIGWSHQQDATSAEAIDFTAARTEDETYYAVWRSHWVYVTFDANNGSFADGDKEKAVKVAYGDPMEEAAIPAAPAREGMNFIGWSHDKDATSAETIDYTAARTENETYYAVYEMITYFVDVDVDGLGQAYASASGAYMGDKIYLHWTAGSQQAFAGWSVPTGNVVITDNAFIMPAADVEVVAKFEYVPSELFAIIENPEEQYKEEGGMAVFHAAAAGVGLTYQWYESADLMPQSKLTRSVSSGLGTWIVIPGATSQTLTVAAIPENNGKAYLCEVTNENNHKLRTAPAHLQIIPPKTGDTTPLELWVMLALASLIIAAVTMKRRKQGI